MHEPDRRAGRFKLSGAHLAMLVVPDVLFAFLGANPAGERRLDPAVPIADCLASAPVRQNSWVE
jgi:hypothetical protein